MSSLIPPLPGCPGPPQCTMITGRTAHTPIARVPLGDPACALPGNGTLSVVRTTGAPGRSTDPDRQGAGVAEGNRTMRGRVLIVDDDTALSEMLSIVLRNEGYDTYLVATGDKAVPAFREFKP